MTNEPEEENYFDKLVRTSTPDPNYKVEPLTISEALQEALFVATENGRTIYDIAKAIRIEPDSLYRFQQGSDIRLQTADKLARELGLELRKIKTKRKKAK
jgi:predicted transcriptional regulator